VPILEYEGLIYIPDLKLGNILMSFEDENVLPNFIKRQQPMQCKVDGDSALTIYRCHNDFGALNGREIKNMVPKITDFGLATRLDKPSTRNGMVGEQLGIYPIQPDYYRVPEVILGCGWDFKADIWNFGVLVRPLYLFSGSECTSIMGLWFPFPLATAAVSGFMLIVLFGQMWNILGSKELFQQVHDTNTTRSHTSPK
jgi:serine/threonine protein kinase